MRAALTKWIIIATKYLILYLDWLDWEILEFDLTTEKNEQNQILFRKEVTIEEQNQFRKSQGTQSQNQSNTTRDLKLSLKFYCFFSIFVFI